MTEEEQIDIIIDILTDFDEMGFAPTTTVPDPETYAIKWRNKLTDALKDYRNRQKAEIEELEAEIDKQYEQAKADILGNMADGGTSCHWCIDQHRAEAVKEFAERLKKECGNVARMEYGGFTYFCVGYSFIDNLVKRFTEETK